MLARDIHNILIKIANTTFPEHKIEPFYVEVHGKELRKHGDYSPLQKKIRIFNLSEKSEYIVATAIHELAHHCEFCIYKNTGHTKQFYYVFKQLLETSVKMGVVSYDEIRKQTTANDIAMLEQFHGKVNVKYDPKMDEKRNKSTIRIYNSFPIKDILSKRKYTYNNIEQIWYKEFSDNLLEEEVSFLVNITDSDNIKVNKANDIKIEAIYYILVANAFAVKDKLYDKGYRFKGFNVKGDYWVKKIKANELNKEKLFLSKLPGIKVSVKGAK